ncbi:hypothetical protein ABZ442_21320 [Streptomyces triculaminicus]|uniref:hypothetical protein n=1 Tax=Streptomyces triculaminicus TaxID=2816232 RepID=UPI0033F9355A
MNDENSARNNLSDLRLAMIDLLTHEPYNGAARDDLAARLIAGDLRFNWWYGQVVKKGLAKGLLWCDPTDLALEYIDLVDSLLEAWNLWKSGKQSGDEFFATLKSTVEQIEDWVGRAPNAPWDPARP